MTEKIVTEIDGNPSGFRRAMQEATQSAKDGARGIESSFSSVEKAFQGVQDRLIALAGILAGGHLFREVIRDTIEFQGESIKLGRALAISASEASILRYALDANNTSQEEFVGAAKKLDKQVKDNEQSLNKMGLATRNSSGELKDQKNLILDAITVLNGYKQGTDRGIAGQMLFGKGFELTSNLVNINIETIKKLEDLQRELGAVVGSENVEAWKMFDHAGDKALLTIKAMKMAIGNALIPVLTDLSNWFASIGPGAVSIIRNTFSGLAATIYIVVAAVDVLWQTFNAMVISVAAPIFALSESIAKALGGDWEGAAKSIASIGPTISNTWASAFDDIVARGIKTRDKIKALFADSTDAASPSKAGKSAIGLLKDKNEKETKEPTSYMQYYEAVLDQEKRLAFERNALLGYSKEEELAYWNFLLSNANIQIRDRVAIERKASDLIVEIKRKEAKQKQELDAEGIRIKETLAMGEVNAEKAAAQISLDLGHITKGQFLRMEQEHENQRYDIQRAALEQRLKLLELDPNTNPVEFARIKNQMLELEQAYELQRLQMLGEIQKESMHIWGDLSERMGGLWDKGIQAMLIGTLNWRNAVKAIGAELVAWFAIDVVGKQVKTWLAGEASKLAISMGFFTQETALQTAASAATSAAKVVEVGTVVAANAAEAASGAAASQASIPIIGPELAMAAAGAMLGFVLGFAATRSAAGGYDIPSGINPVVQTHAEEMILPKNLANVIRGLDKVDGANTPSSPQQTTSVVLSVHPDAMRMTIRDVLEGEFARISMGGK